MPRRSAAQKRQRYIDAGDVSLELLPRQIELLESTAPIVGFIAGYGAGKSHGGAVKALQLATVNQGMEGMIVSPTHKMLVRVTLAAFLKLAKNIIVEHHKQEQRIDLCNGSRVWYASADTPGSLEGSNLAWFTLDEARLVSQEAYNILLGRLRVGAAPLLQGVVTSTPTAGGWLQKEFDNGPEGRQVIRSSSRDNHFLAPGYVENMMSSYSAAQVKCYIDGEWNVLEGQVYPEFDRELHMIDFVPQNDWPTVCGVDFGVRYPAVIYAQIAQDHRRFGSTMVRKGSLVCFDEDLTGMLSSESLGMRIARTAAANRLNIEWIACDPAGATLSSSASEHGGIMDVIALKNGLAAEGVHAPIRYVRGQNTKMIRSINNGVEKVRGRLLNAKGETFIYFANSLQTGKNRERGVMRMLVGLTYAPGSHKILRGAAANQLCHIGDALRYMVRHIDLQGGGAIQTA